MRSFSGLLRRFEEVEGSVILSGKEFGNKEFGEERVEAVTAASRILIIGCLENLAKMVASTLCSSLAQSKPKKKRDKVHTSRNPTDATRRPARQMKTAHSCFRELIA
jgi:hypothetical protein